MNKKLFSLGFRVSNVDGGVYAKVLFNCVAWKNPLHAEHYDLRKSANLPTWINTLCNDNYRASYLRLLPSNVDTVGFSLNKASTVQVEKLLRDVSYSRNTTVNISHDQVIIDFYDELSEPSTNPSVGALFTCIIKLAPTNISDNEPPPSKKGVKMYRCSSCGGYSEDKNYLKECKSSTGKKFKMCNYCSKTKKCDCCGFDEPVRGIRGVLDISQENGENIKLQVCSKCSSEKFSEECRGCGYYFNYKELRQCPCQIRQDFKGMIQPFNADVLKFYKKDAYSDELFGIEIEAGTLARNRRIFPEIAETTGQLIGADAIMKYDSSIDYINKAEGVKNHYRGFEVVTRPMIYKNTIRFMKNFCKNRHPTLKAWEVGTCGLHIHVSKKCLRPIEIGKILLFVNSKANRNFIKMLAKREDKKYAKFLPKRIVDYNKNTPGANGVPAEHYEAINTSKPYTIEFRMFRGTLNPQTMVSYLQFVKSLIEFVRVTENVNLTYKKYVDWLFSTERSSFRELKERIKSEQVTRIAEDGEI